MSQRTKKKRKVKAKERGWRTAKTSDIHELYELSVQEPEADIDLVDQVWSERRKGQGKATLLREDFCGTANASMEWVRRRPTNEAIGVDLEPSVLEWGRQRIDDRLSEDEASRLTLIEDDVVTVDARKVQIIGAWNFSYYLFKTRDALRAYFKNAYDGLLDGGIFMLDAYGGSDSFLEMEEERHLDGFTYVWDQNTYSPITGNVVNHIHFRFPDGTQIENAFTYEWRLWTLPEIRELLLEAGFDDVVVYWEGDDDETDEGNGEWAVSDTGEACEGWIAYIVAEKN